MSQKKTSEEAQRSINIDSFHLLAVTACLISVRDITGLKLYFRHHCLSCVFKVTHRVTAGRIQHGRWSTKQAKKLSAAPLLCWQVPAWVDHPQREQRWSHSLDDYRENERQRVSEAGWTTWCTETLILWHNTFLQNKLLRFKLMHYFG